MAFQLGASSSSLPSSSPSIRSWNHDVFLSFRGDDVRDNFISHLYKALVGRGINTYIDNNLERGDEISPALFKAIEGSMISIIVLSENYAESKWCLDELLKIIDCKETIKQIVLPIFFKVDPSEVRHQKEIFGRSFDKLGDKLKDNANMLKWKKALEKVANFAGFPSANFRDESECIEEIVQQVSSKLPNRTRLHVADHPVGLDSRAEDIINTLLGIEIINETRMIGIFGIGGIGKTTITKEVFNRIANQFEGRCFLANVRENSKTKKSLVKLQKKILSTILGDPKVEVDDVDQGINMIQEKLCSKKILLILDDVDDPDQLKYLSGRSNWFGLGSRIIITTRDEHLLVQHDVGIWKKYPMNKLDPREALKLFSWHAFKHDQPDNDFVELTKLALQYAGGLPLALIVVGSNLQGRDTRFWECQLKKYKRIPNKKIYDILKISFNGLDDVEKNIFLDIACFFKGDEREYVTKILYSCDFFPNAGIEVLKDKCLITIDQFDRLWMHDLLEDMGKEIVRQESPQEPGKRSRLWFQEDVCEVLKKNKGTKQIEGILIDLPREDRETQLSTKTFAKLENLRIFINRNATFCGGLEYLFESNKLRVLDWLKCPLEFLPSTFHGEKLIVLKMQESRIRDLGTRSPFKNLTSIDFSRSKYLKKISDHSSCSNLEKLILDECEGLVEVHDSVGFLDKLVELNFLECSRLKNLPRSFKLRSLELLELRGCTSLEYFPEIVGEMEYLKRLWLESTVIQELPSSITYLTGLEILYLRWCESLMRLPIDIFQLECLEEVEVLHCPNLINFGKEVGQNGQSMPCTHALLPLLSPKSKFSLRKLSLSGSSIVSLPPWIEGLVGLSHLDLVDCKQLEKILQLPPNIEVVDARRCIKLVEIHDSIGFLDKLVKLRLEGCSRLKNLPRIFKLRSLEVLEIEGCTSLEYFPEIECEVKHLKRVRLDSTVIQELPSSITYLTSLEKLYLKGCKSLVRFPINISSSTKFSSSLRYLTLDGSGIVSLPPCIKGFVRLHSLGLGRCEQLEEILHLPPNIQELDVFGCMLLERFLHVSTKSSFGMPDLKRLSTIDLSECNKVHVDVGNHAPDPLLVQKCFQEKKSSTIIYPGSRIPEWFKYCKETTSYTNSIEIEIDHNASMCFGHQIVALVLCFVVRPLQERTAITINGQQIIRLSTSKDPHRVCLKYMAANSVDEMLSGSDKRSNNMRFTFGSGSKQAIFKSAAVHLIQFNVKETHEFSLSDLKTATRNFKTDSLLGKGSFGKVFKGWMNEKTLTPCEVGTGMVVAIENFSSKSMLVFQQDLLSSMLGFQQWQTVQSELNFLGRLSHPNLVKLLGYCLKEKEKVLVYEYMQRASLDNHLFRTGNPNIKPLSWDIRLKIAIGAARGLAFLHTLENEVIYGGFKSSNILLDGNYNAKISAFGLAKLRPKISAFGLAKLRSRIPAELWQKISAQKWQETLAELHNSLFGYGCDAPEYLETGHFNVESGVYGFGVVLLEILTGLRALDRKRPSGQQNLVEWLKPSLSNKRKLKTIMDTRMKGQYSSKAVLQAAELTLKCRALDPKGRPSMIEVAAALESI